MNAGIVASKGDVCCEFVQLASDRECSGVGAAVRQKLETVVAGLDDASEVVDGAVAIEEGFEQSAASTGDRGVALRVGRMLRAAFGKCLREKIRFVGGVS